MRECKLCKQCYPDAVTTCPQDSQPTFHSIGGNPILEGKYRLEKRIGQGGMGVVYQARHNYLKTSHAIKVILPDLVGNDPQLVTRFRQEALAAAAIRHPNVVQVTDYGVANDTMPFLVMEYVEGESLQDVLAREKRLTPESAVEYMSAICAGVGAAHRQGIVHRDLKPLNIMVLKGAASPAEGIRILDFGLAKIKSGELLGSFVQAQTTGLMGSPYYMAPEQWADEEPDAQADIYSLGVILYQMLAGDVPFKGSSIPAIMQKHLNTPPPAFLDFGVQIAPSIEEAVRHSLAKDRHQRTQTVQQFVEELRRGIGLSTQSLHATGTPNLSSSAVHVLTSPPQSKVFVDGVPVGETQPDGYLLLEGIQSGNHRLKITKDGFHDWENQIFCDGSAQQIVAQLQHFSGGNVTQQMTENQSLPPQTGFLPTQQNAGTFLRTNQVSQMEGSGNSTQNLPTGNNTAFQPTLKKSIFSPLFLAITGIFGLLVLTGIGIAAGYFLGLFGGAKQTASPIIANSTKATSQTTPGVETPVSGKNSMVEIAGGKFKMGSNSGPMNEQPMHDVEVLPFAIDKTEVTNAEYFEFVKESGYKAPSHWAEGKPVAGKEMLPVVFVSIEDIEKFIEWRSKRDGVQYRLPSEEEWEFVARNGGEDNIYPWGNDIQSQNAVMEQASAIAVGSIPSGADKWGVMDLMGNVWEWTGSEAKLYPGNKGSIVASKIPKFMIRGGCFNSRLSGENAVSATTRKDIDKTRQDGLLGFRLVRGKK